MEIHQVLVGISPGDAISNEALRIRSLLRRAGPSEIFAQYIGEGMEDIRFLHQYRELESSRGGGNILLVHSSIGEAAVFDFLNARPERIVMRFHNITPPAMFAPFDPPFKRLLEQGVHELEGLRGRVVLAMAVSAFNARALEGFGYRNIHVVPLLMDLSGLLAIPPQPLPGLELPPPGTGPLILFVGRISPNKGQPDLLKAFHVLKTYHYPDARLWCVGGKAHGRYRAALDHFIAGLGLRDVVFTGPISDPQLAAVFRRADVYLSLSAHEGFGVPLVEAMAHGIPVIAWDTTAVGETVGGAGVLLADPGPLAAAEAVKAVLEDQDLRRDLVARGRARASVFTMEDAERSFLETLLGAV
ncbi:MAG: glycosyltransferase family 4 protein [Candidatus Dormibacteria bacterium]